MERSSVLLPHPLAPIITNMSPRCTAKLRFRCTTWSPNASVTPSTEISVSFAGIGDLQTQHVEQHGEQCIGHDYRQNAGDDCRRRGSPYRRGTPARLNTAQAAG